jgi:predicted permease
MLLAFAGVRFFIAISPANLPRLSEVHVSWPILLFAASLTGCTALLFGSLPALRSLRTEPQQVLQSVSIRIFSVREATATRRFLVMFEVASTVVLLIFTSLVARSFSRILNQDRAFDSNHVIVAQADLLNPRYDGDSGAIARSAFIDHALDRLRANTNVQFAAVTSTMPLTGETNLYGIRREDHPLPESRVPLANLRNISPQYFAAMRIPLVAGQDFEEKEREHPEDAIISERTAKVAWSGENPLGRTFRINGRTYTVTGIAADARIADLKLDAPVVYLPYWHDPPASVLFVIRSPQPLDGIASSIRLELWDVDPQVAIPAIKSLNSQINESVSAERFQIILLSCFGVAALMLAVMGVYGVISYSVSLREQEFGVRVALGSSGSALMRLVLLEASFPVLAGLTLGAVAAGGATRLIRSLLYETATTDPAAIAFSIGLLLLSALLAALFPAYHACNADPMQALRRE